MTQALRDFLEKMFPTLGRKFAAAVVLVLLTTGFAFVFLAYRTGSQMLEKQAQATAHATAEFGKAILEHVMLEGDNKHLQSALKLAITSGEASDALILKPDGTVALSAKDGRVFEKFPMENFRPLPEWKGDRFWTVHENGDLYEYIITPIVKKPECYRCHKEPETTCGYFAVNVAMNNLRAISRSHSVNNIMMAAVIFGGLGSVIFIALFVLVISPIRKLRTHMHQVENGLAKLESGEQTMFPLFNSPKSKDEVADLSRAFNNLIEQLNQTNAKLHEMHQMQLEQADRLATTGEMAASIAHEIRNPVAGVLGALQIFDTEISKDDPHKEIIAEMMEQLGRINRTTNDLLSYARPSPPVFEEVKIDEVVEKTISLLSPQLKAASIKMDVSLQNHNTAIIADRNLLQQLLWNIMLNAVQAMPGGGTLAVKTSKENSSVKIEITDTGSGISQENLEKIFKPFFTTKHKGTGLGMAISKRIVEQHKGSITISSEVHKGTVVTISIPIKQSHG